MAQSAGWYMDITGNIFEGIGPRTNPEIGKFIEESGEMVKMLTPDGKVVEVPAANIKAKKSKTKNKDILQWRDLPDKNNKQNS